MQSGLILAIGTVAAAICASAADGGAKRGEIGIGTDDQLAGALERFRMTKVTDLVGWTPGSGKDADPVPAATLQAMRHVIVTRFSVPRPQDPRNADRHLEQGWLERRLDLFRRFFVPSVSCLGVPAVLLCSSKSATFVDEKTTDLDWVEVEVQDDWYGGWVGDDDQTVTRMDSDDAIHQSWLAVVDAAPPDAEVCCTREFLRYDISSGRLCAYKRGDPSPLAAFRNGRNPFAEDHAGLDRHYRVHNIAGPFLLQTFHGGNVSSRRPSWYRRRLPLEHLEAYGIR